MVFGLFLWLCAPGAEAREVVVGVFENPPIIVQSAPGKFSGIAIDTLEEIARREAWSVRYRHASWNTLLRELAEGKLDILTGIAYTPERAAKYAFTDQTLVVNWGVVYQHPGIPISSLVDLNGKRIAAMHGSTHTQAFISLTKSFGLNVELIEVGSYEQVLEKVASGEADAGVVNRLFSALRAGDYKVTPTSIVFNPISVRYAAPRDGNPAIIAALNAGMARLKADPSSVY